MAESNLVTLIKELIATIASSEKLLNEIPEMSAEDRAEVLGGIGRLQRDIETLRGHLLSVELFGFEGEG